LRLVDAPSAKFGEAALAVVLLFASPESQSSQRAKEHRFHDDM
jgi:hypothetical protein